MLVLELAPALPPEGLRKEHLRLGGLRVVTGGEQGVAGFGQTHRIAPAPAGEHAAGSGTTEEELGSFGMVVRAESKRRFVEALGSVGRVERGGRVARVGQGAAGRFSKPRHLEAGSL